MSGSVALEKGYDHRLSRLAKNSLDDKEEIRANHRCIRQEEIVLNEEEESVEVEEDDEDAVYEHRRILKEKLLQRDQEEKNAMIIEEEEESEYETDSEDEHMSSMAMMKPVFVKKSERDTIAEREKIEAEERAIEDFMKMRVEERKVETKQMVIEEIRKDIEIQKNKETKGEITDVDMDEENIEELYLAWIPREFARIKRDREVRDAMVQEKEDIKRDMNMTEEARKEWERKNPKPDGAPKQKWKYMQRYYHKGAFFQDNRDDTAGTAGADGIL